VLRTIPENDGCVVHVAVGVIELSARLGGNVDLRAEPASRPDHLMEDRINSRRRIAEACHMLRHVVEDQ
jgi:hypothetical protein